MPDEKTDVGQPSTSNISSNQETDLGQPSTFTNRETSVKSQDSNVDDIQQVKIMNLDIDSTKEVGGPIYKSLYG